MRATINGLRIAIVALLFYWILLFVGTHIPANAVLGKLYASDKVLHAAAFAGLAFLMAWAIPTDRSRIHKNTVFAAFVCVIYAAVDEILQIPVGRTADWKDFVADCVGVCVGLGTYTIARAIIIKADWNLFTTSTPPESSEGTQ